MSRDKLPGVYLMVDKDTGKGYVGSSDDIPRRMQEHGNSLKRGAHRNHNLQRAFDKSHHIETSIFPTQSQVDARLLEQALLDQFAPTGQLYNLAKDVERPNLGKTLSPEVRKKISDSHIGITHTAETKALLSEIGKRRGVLQSTTDAAAVANRGRPLSEDRIVHLRALALARKTPESDNRLGALRLDAVQSEEAKEKIRTARLKVLNRTVVVAGQEFASLVEAEKATTITRKTIRRRISDASGKFDDYYLMPCAPAGS